MEKTRRVQMELAQASYERLNRLKDEVEASTYTEVMKDALRLYEFFVDRDAAGDAVLLRDKTGATSQVKLFLSK